MRKAFLVAVTAVICLGASAPPARADAFRARAEQDAWWPAGARHDGISRPDLPAAMHVRWDASMAVLHVQWDDDWWKATPRDGRHLSDLIQSALSYLRRHDGARFDDWRNGGALGRQQRQRMHAGPAGSGSAGGYAGTRLAAAARNGCVRTGTTPAEATRLSVTSLH